MRMMIASFMMLSGAGCASTAPAAASSAHAATAAAQREVDARAVDDALSDGYAAHPGGVDRLRRELFVLRSERKLAIIAGRIQALRTRAERLEVPADGTVARSINDLAQRHALAVEQLTEGRARVGDALEMLEESINATLIDLDVRSGQVALRLAFLAMR